MLLLVQESKKVVLMMEEESVGKCLSLSQWMILFTFERLALSARVQGDVIGFHILSNTRTLNLDISDKKSIQI